MKQSQNFTLTAPVKPVDQVAEVANEVGREAVEAEGYQAPISFLITGGTITSQLHGKTENDFYGEYVEAVKWGGPRRYLTLQTNAKPKEEIRWFRSLGLDDHNANMEVCRPPAVRVDQPWEEPARRVGQLGEVDVRLGGCAG